MVSAQLPVLSEGWRQTCGWQPTPEQQQQCQKLFECILQANQHLNLTRILDPQEFWEKHLWDSLLGIAPWLCLSSPQPIPDWLQQISADLSLTDPDAMKVIDIGTGGGFPGLPVAIIQPHWSMTLLDSTQKKLTALEPVIAALGLKQVTTCCDRAETLGQNPAYRQSFDLALIRAVGTASVCAEYALPLVRLQGYAILYRGQLTHEEEQTLAAVLPSLGGKIVAVAQVPMPLSSGVRHCIYIHKHQPTDPKFPRRVGLPARRPL
ncbi:MAG: 16S rRNA (guanine(527)-N(7))-methyltransferase RsmG [Acaryochloris sp. RU_4_1]|nr:16S rRNA (guanine(527)-N(7))-methyltransferase RsmG [Acaryochloris sp. SU_5_25]NJM66026.1 16S rRNA (guanine(527)-N(7))-methyltransferase RsmG [Acaryochloris sp. RU_4_1]NJN37616.1 16S rRNA (guanine(527)-N(7))-methyltransferase RsmG [Acaryochloridaceae cyanobacterium CSU_3_4]NJR53763.1 16S rRNA (guanine(527)-N(7))-methyltransferase RsmG [Acaryochloris sp. CRU_2_0]